MAVETEFLATKKPPKKVREMTERNCNCLSKTVPPSFEQDGKTQSTGSSTPRRT